MGKRDRWDSSSDEEEEAPKQQQQPSSSTATTSSDKHIPLHNPLLHGCRSVYDTYEQISHISEGSYGVVWKARDLFTNEIVALKQVKLDDENKDDGFPIAALREINVLLALSHDNIVSVREMVVGTETVYMVLEYFAMDLKQGLDRYPGALAQAELKSLLQQILAGVAHIHAHSYLHRDLKTTNVLVHVSGRVAVADFGLAKQHSCSGDRALTPLVVTLWYRAPELLLGEVHYGTPVDVWSVGCILGELITREAILQGQGELDQLDRIFALVGTPTPETWPGYESLPNAGMFRWKPKKERLLSTKFTVAAPVSGNQAFLDRHGYDLLSRLLTLDPKQRITAQEALDHAYFQQGVKPQVPRFFTE